MFKCRSDDNTSLKVGWSKGIDAWLAITLGALCRPIRLFNESNFDKRVLTRQVRPTANLGTFGLRLENDGGVPAPQDVVAYVRECLDLLRQCP